jgi:hypothetical protein
VTSCNVGRQSQLVIEVYGVATLNFRRNLSIPNLRCFSDMTSCPQCDEVYIGDDCADKIIAINEHGVVVFNWFVDGLRLGLSVNSQLNVVVVIVRQQLQVFTRRGEFVRNVSLQSDIKDVWQAIQLDDDRYVVVHGVGSEALHRVCIVNGNGTIVQSYGGKQGSDIGQLDAPIGMLTFGGSLIVADYSNYRVLLFNVSTLTYVRELISTRDTHMPPNQLAISDDGTRLFVSYSRQELRAFNVTWI